MENLGLGGLKFEKSHNESLHRTPDGEFKELHDAQSLHKHNHTRLRRAFSKLLLVQSSINDNVGSRQ